MDNNQNDNSKSKWCPNVIFEKGNISIGEFKTLDEAMSFPIPDKWCVNRTVGDNKFEKFMVLNVRVLIICDWSKSIQDSRKFVIALVYPDGQTIYYDFNNIQIDANVYETSLDEDVFNAIERVVVAHYKLHNPEVQNENKQHKTRYNMKKTIRLSESDLHRIISESVRRVINEYDDPTGYGNSQLTVGDLLAAWEQYGGKNERVEIFDGVNGFKCVHCIDGNYLFMSRKDYETYKKRGEEYDKQYAKEHSGKYGGGEGNQYLSNPSNLPAGLH